MSKRNIATWIFIIVLTAIDTASIIGIYRSEYIFFVKYLLFSALVYFNLISVQIFLYVSNIFWKDD